MTLEVYEIPDQQLALQPTDKILVSDQTQPDGSGYRSHQELLETYENDLSTNKPYIIQKTGTVDPIGNVTGIAGDLYIRQGGAFTQFHQNLGSIANDSDWCVIQRVCGAFQASESGNAVETVISTVSTPVLAEYDLTVSPLNFNFQLEADGQTMTYVGPDSFELRNIYAQVSCLQAGTGGETNFAVYVYRNRDGAGFVQESSPGIFGLDDSNARTMITQSILDLENGDQFQIWVANLGNTANVTLVSTEFLMR